MEEELEESTGEQGKNKGFNPKSLANLQPHQYKKGQSGNPNGRPEGISLKEYVKKKFRTMNDDERETFLEGIDKKSLWEMGEDKAKQGVDADISLTSKIVRLDIE